MSPGGSLHDWHAQPPVQLFWITTGPSYPRPYWQFPHGGAGVVVVVLVVVVEVVVVEVVVVVVPVHGVASSSHASPVGVVAGGAHGQGAAQGSATLYHFAASVEYFHVQFPPHGAGVVVVVVDVVVVP